MTLFWILSAAMILIAFAMIAPTLLRKKITAGSDRNQQNILIARERLAELKQEKAEGHISDEEYTVQQSELEKVLLQDTANKDELPSAHSHTGHGKAALLGVAVLVPVVSVLLYRQLGTPGIIDVQPIKQASASQTGSPHAGSMEDMAIKLRRRLEQKTPNDGNGWFLLGRTYMTMKDYPSAVDAFEHSYRLMDNDPGAMLALADALSMTQQGRIQGQAAELVEKALSLDPQNTTAMWMAGLVAEDKGNYKQALTLWKRLLPRFAGAPDEQRQLNSQIARVSIKAGLPVPKNNELPSISDGAMQGKPEAKPSQATNDPARIELRVELSPEMQQQADANDTVFVYARAMQGPKFPLAAIRYKVSDLPLTVTLDDSSAIMPAAKLSDFQRVKVGARVSRSGNAISSKGDLFGEVEKVRVGDSKTIEIAIDKVY